MRRVRGIDRSSAGDATGRRGGPRPGVRPGITEAQARELVARGFHDFSDVVRLALPESAVKQGLHHAIARRALLAEIAPKVRRVAKGDRCPVCGSRWPKDAERCPTCGSAATTVLRVEQTEQEVERVAGEIIGASGETDFRERLETIRRGIEDTFQGVDPKDLMREEYGRQIDAWRAKGFDVTPLEALLAADVDEFRKQAVRLIRGQIRRKAVGGAPRCPLCNEALAPEATECGNCGAKFA